MSAVAHINQYKTGRFYSDEFRGDFSWNMYAKRYTCDSRYWVLPPDGRRVQLAHKRDFRRPNKAPAVLHRDRLPAFHAHLCESLGPGKPRLASVRCSLNEGPKIALVEEDVDLCTAPDHGVRRWP